MRFRTGRRIHWLWPVLAGIVAAVAVLLYGSPQGHARITNAGTMVRLYRVEDGATLTLPLEEYLLGAVAAQMPANAPLEALRAQAVAARSLACYRLVPQGTPGIQAAADISDDPRQGQPWISTAEMHKRWGWLYPFYYLKIADAVWSTRGEIATYGKEPIDAVSFDDSGGHGTESAADIWGVDVPYLRRVAPLAAEPATAGAAYRFDAATLDKLLGGRVDPLGPVRVLSRTASGRPLVVQLGTTFLTAGYLAERLHLPSSYFDLRSEGGDLLVSDTGSGDGVGMCRAGAEFMAARGARWPEIIRHYFTGVEITRLPGA